MAMPLARDSSGVCPCPGRDYDCLKTATETLSGYNMRPFIVPLMGPPWKRKPWNQANMLQCLRALSVDVRNKPNCRDLVKYLDKLKMWGRQNIFLYNLKAHESSYLDDLLDPEYIKDRLQRAGLEDRYNRDLCIWESDQPCLSQVIHGPQPRGRGDWLSFKWVHTLQYQKLVLGVPQFLRYRSVNFFLIDLLTGHAQLRIQKLPPRALMDLKRLEREYTALLEQFVELERFRRVDLSAIMKTMLQQQTLPIPIFHISSFLGDVIGNNIKKTFVNQLLILLGQFRPRKITAVWKCKQKAHGLPNLNFRIDADKGSISFGAVCDKPRVDFILELFHQAGKEGHQRDAIRTPALRELAEKYPNYYPIVLAVDLQLRAHKSGAVHAPYLAEELGFGDLVVSEVFRLAAKEHPNTFACRTIEGAPMLRVVGTERPIQRKSLLDLADRNPERRPVLRVIDAALRPRRFWDVFSVRRIFTALFGPSEFRRIRARDIAPLAGFNTATITEVFLLIESEYPGKFEVEYEHEDAYLTRKSYFYDGLLNATIRTFARTRLHAWLKALIGLSGIGLLGTVLQVSSTAAVQQLVEAGIPSIFGVPFWLAEVLAHILVAFVLFGTKRIRKYVVAPATSGLSNLRDLIAATPSSIPITERRFRKWRPRGAFATRGSMLPTKGGV
ncbi:MAG: hypothetical protein GY867_04520 [bacterium]|nr:hypothetical protein [bacterium]